MAKNRVSCPSCGAKLSTSAEPGRKIKCPKCAGVVPIPEERISPTQGKAKSNARVAELDEKKPTNESDVDDRQEADGDERPRKAKKTKKTKRPANSSLSPGVMIGGGIAIGFVILVGATVGVLAMTGVFSTKTVTPDKSPLAFEEKNKKVGDPLEIPRVRQAFASIRGHQKVVSSIDVAPDGKTLASASWDGTIGLWDLDPLKERARLHGHKGMVHVVRFSPNGAVLASAGLDGIVRLWNVLSQEKRELKGFTGDVYTLAFSPDGKTVAAGSSIQWNEGTTLNVQSQVLLWDVASGENRGIIKGKRAHATAVAFVKNGKGLAVADGAGEVTFWDLGSLQPTLSIKVHSEGIRAMAGTPDGKLLATGGRDRVATLWDGATGEKTTTLQGQTTMVARLAFSKDGSLLAAAIGDIYGDDSEPRGDEVRIWNMETKQLRQVLEGQRGFIVSVAFGAQAKVLITGGNDGVIRMWKMLAPGEKGDPIPSTTASSDDGLVDAMINQKNDLAAAIREFGGRMVQEPNGDIVEINLINKKRKITDAGLVHLKDLTKLKFLGITGNPITDSGLQHLRGLKSLENLNAGQTQITDNGLIHLKELPNLKFLDLRQTQVTDAGVEHLKHMKKLEQLTIGGAKMTSDGADALRLHLPKCNVLLR